MVKIFVSGKPTVDFQYSAISIVDIEDDAGVRKIERCRLRELGRIMGGEYAGLNVRRRSRPWLPLPQVIKSLPSPN